MSKNTKTVLILLVIVACIVIIPIFALRGAEFGGADDAAGTVVKEINPEYEATSTPLLEQLLGGEIPGEIESLLFCVQTGIGVGIIAFYMGRLVERKKQEEMRKKITHDHN